MKILIVDDDVDIIEIITFFIESKFKMRASLSTSIGGFEAIELLKKGDFDLCICDHNMPNGNGSDVLRFIQKAQKITKFVLCSSVAPEDMPNDYREDKIYFSITKPDIESGINKLSQLIAQDFQDNSEAISSTQSEYVPIMINLLFLISEMPCDIYLSLSEQKFLKCLREGEVFGEQDLEKYVHKNVYQLYAPRGKHEADLIKVVNSALVKIINDSKKPIDIRMLEIHSQVTSLFKIYGYSHELVNIAKDSIKNTVKELIKNDKIENFWKRLNLSGDYPARIYVAHSTICGLLSSKISWLNETVLDKLVTACFFQNIALDSIDVMMITNYSDFMNKKETLTTKAIENYLNHPHRSLEILSQLKISTSDVEKIILEQHEMPGGQGFPRKLNYLQISPLSALFILSGMLAKYILKYEDKADFNMIFYSFEEAEYNKGNFKESFNVLKNLFLKS